MVEFFNIKGDMHATHGLLWVQNTSDKNINVQFPSLKPLNFGANYLNNTNLLVGICRPNM